MTHFICSVLSGGNISVMKVCDGNRCEVDGEVHNVFFSKQCGYFFVVFVGFKL